MYYRPKEKKRHPVVTFLAERIYRVLQKIDPSFRLARVAKNSSKTYLRCTEKIAEGAIHLMRESGCDAVCCGHTHNAQQSAPYFNSGSWTELPCTYLVIENGNVQLRKYPEVDSQELNEVADRTAPPAETSEVLAPVR